MSRTIKYRVWWEKTEHEEGGKWLEGCFLLTQHGKVVLPHQFSLFEKHYEEGLYQYAPEELGWVFEQFTGLHDKNDKPIFEGDILKHTQSGSMYPVRYAIDSGHAMFVIQPLRTPKLILHKDISDTHEVIGNIHEDAEMLEKWARKIDGPKESKDSA